MKSEKTSARVARIAGRVLAIRAGETHAQVYGWEDGAPGKLHILWSDIRALAASALTQAEDKPKRATKAGIDVRKVKVKGALYERWSRPKPRRRARRK